MGGIKFDLDNDVPELSEKVILITGGTSGLGQESLIALAKHNPDHIYFTGRNAENAKNLINQVKTTNSRTNLTFLECDFTSLASISATIKPLNLPRLDILMCNAGVMACPPELTKDGYELQFGINHLAHALIITLLLPTLLQTASQHSDARIISLTSTGFRYPPSSGIVFSDLRTTQDHGTGWAWLRYGQSKLANVVYASELAKRHPSITTVSIHPGIVGTGLVGNLSMGKKLFVFAMCFWRITKVADGIRNQCWAATAKKEDLVNGAFYEPVGMLGGTTKLSEDEGLAERLWEWTEGELKGFL